ncbi:hypothetical protein BPAE_0012g00290 [Botrytis paeoniae]|uniref:Uncharacterized protein n=1 Tax=Botrytis paeoniae TaxID=278948 RepID=A0A4Z1FYR7_9HELO|nr:hypothetical protein BPAE_0012g00290 [Botrytis paeoniae]
MWSTIICSGKYFTRNHRGRTSISQKHLSGTGYTVEALDAYNSTAASSTVASISSPTLPDSEASCTYFSGIDCAIDCILASEKSAIPATKAMIMSAKIMMSTQFATNDKLIPAGTGSASTTETAQEHDRQLTREGIIAAVICEPVAFNWLIGTILIVFYRRGTRVRGLKRNSQGYSNAELDSRPLQPHFAKIDDLGMYQNWGLQMCMSFQLIVTRISAQNRKEEVFFHEIG